MKQRILSKKEWDYIVCPDKIAERVLTSAGYDFRGCKIYLGSKAVSPYSMQRENVLTWTTVGDFLKDKGLIDFDEDWQCVKAIKEYYMKLNEAEKVLKDAGYIMEASKYDYEYELLKDYFPDAKDLDIHANRSIRSPLWKTLYGWECEFYLNGKRHWFTFGKGGCGFEPSLQAYIRKYCKLDSFDDYKEIKKSYPEASLEDIREIAKMG